jgi:hypothetical protein
MIVLEPGEHEVVSVSGGDAQALPHGGRPMAYSSPWKALR